MTFEPGAMLPDIDLVASDGEAVSLRRFAGQPLVIYFYPKDDTPGCTREAQDFSALKDDFDQVHVTVIGVSKDSPAKHRKFSDKYALSVPLASDEDGRLMEAMGVWVEKSMYGRSYMGIERATFLFDAGGKLVKSWRKVKVAGHAAEVLAAARALAA